MRNRFIEVGLASSLLFVPTALSAEAVTGSADSPIVLIDLMTGADATTNTAEQWDVGATDLGIMWDDGQGGVLTAFGDTFSTPTPGGNGTGNWRSNVLLRSTDANLADGMSFDSAVTNEAGAAIEVFPGKHVFDGTEVTKIPTAGIEVNGTQYMTYMSVREWGEPGQWQTNYSQLAYSTDGGQTWSIDGAPRWDNNADFTDPFQMASFAKADGYVYMFTTPNGRIHDLHVARVPEADVLDQSAYTYWNGSAWVAEQSAAAVIVEGPVSETSVRYDEFSGKWQLIYLDGNADLVYRTADEPTGAWSAPTVLGTQAEYPGLYGGFIHPWSEDGDVYIALSIWDEYNVSLMHFKTDEHGNLVQPNLLDDPGFEEATTLGAVTDGWQVQGRGGIDTNSAWAKQGRHQFWVRHNAGEQLVVQQVQLEPYASYRLTGWLTSGDSVGGGAGEGRIGAREVGPGASVLGMQTFGDLDGYTQFVVEFETGASGLVEIFAGSTMTADRWVQGDSFSLVQTSPSSTPVEPPTDPATPPADDPSEPPSDDPSDEPTGEPTDEPSVTPNPGNGPTIPVGSDDDQPRPGLPRTGN